MLHHHPCVTKPVMLPKLAYVLAIVFTMLFSFCYYNYTENVAVHQTLSTCRNDKIQSGLRNGLSLSVIFALIKQSTCKLNYTDSLQCHSFKNIDFVFESGLT